MASSFAKARATSVFPAPGGTVQHFDAGPGSLRPEQLPGERLHDIGAVNEFGAQRWEEVHGEAGFCFARDEPCLPKGLPQRCCIQKLRNLPRRLLSLLRTRCHEYGLRCERIRFNDLSKLSSGSTTVTKNRRSER